MGVYNVLVYDQPWFASAPLYMRYGTRFTVLLGGARANMHVGGTFSRHSGTRGESDLPLAHTAWLNRLCGSRLCCDFETVNLQ